MMPRVEEIGMVAHPEPATMTVEEYLALEEASQVKHESVRSRVCAMAGGTIAPNRIANNLRTALDNHVGEGPCMVLGPGRTPAGERDRL
jgi:hypothetical protein